MNWKVKALIQHTVSLLPSQASHALYYTIQRACGSLRSVNPIAGLEDGMRIIAGIEEIGRSVENKVFLELGTGRRINVPIALWLCGASRIITVDPNPYLKMHLIAEDIAFIKKNRALVRRVFGGRSEREGFRKRFDMIARDGISARQFMEQSQIRYVAPLDATQLPLEDRTIDFYVSNNVLEHVPPDALSSLLIEGKRVIGDDGLLVHRIDFADHFSEFDPAISTVNFLQYSEEQWMRYAGNRYNYHNRLRIDEFEAIVRDVGLAIVSEKPEIDQDALRVIESGLKLDPRFAHRPSQVNATESALVLLGRPASAGRARRHGMVERRVSGSKWRHG